MKTNDIEHGKWSARGWATWCALIAVSMLCMTISTTSLACHKGKPHGKDAPENCDGSGGGGDPDPNDAPDPSHLVRASFLDFVGPGVFADGLDSCTITRNGGLVTYDYWAWQERLHVDAISMLDDGIGGDGLVGCHSYDNRSDVSGGGRWFLMTTGHPETPDKIERWLTVDFSDGVEFEGLPSVCPDLDGDNSIYTGPHGFPAGTPATTMCVDNLTVWLGADRILKNSANYQQLDIKIRHRPEGSQYWVPWGAIQHVDPLYLRNPHPDGPFGGRDCRVMSTRASHDALTHDRQLAELLIDLGPGKSDVIGRYNLPLEVCIIRVSD